MPTLRYVLPMATLADELRFRTLWAQITHDPHVHSADAAPRYNPFIQEITVEISHNREGFANTALAGALVPYLPGSTPFPEDPLTTPASATADTSWLDLVPNWVRPGCWVRSGSTRFLVLRVDVPRGQVMLQAEDRTEPENVSLEALRFFLAGQAPPPPLPPPPTVWDRLLGARFDDD